MGWQDAPLAAAEPQLPVPAWSRAPIAGAPERKPAANEVPMVAGSLKQHFESNARSAKTFDDFLSAGFQSSVTGLAARGKAPDVQLDETAPWYGRAAASVAGMAGDVPAMIGGALIATAGTAGRGGPVLAAGGAFALPAGLRAVMMDAYTHGEISSSSEFVDRALSIGWETAKGWLTGAATGGAGVFAKAATAGSAVAVKALVPTAAEIATMTTVGRALEGHLPEPQDFVDAAIVIGGFKAAGTTASRLRQIYAKTGIPPEQVVADAAKDPHLADELVAAPMAGEQMQLPGIPKAYEVIAKEETARAIVPGEKTGEVAASPFALELPQAAGEPSKPTHVNYNYITSTEDAKLALARLSQVYEQEIQTQRRGKVSWEQTSAETAKLLSDTMGGVDTKLIMPREPGTPAGAAELLARKQMVVGAAEAMMAARDDILAKGANATQADHLAFLQAIERASMIQKEFLGARAEAGRALNILKNTTTESRRAEQIQNVIASWGMGEPKKAIPKTPQTAKFVNNTVFTENAVIRARALLKSKIGTLNSGLDPETLQAGLTIAGAHIEAGVRTFADFSSAMVADLGDAIKPHLKDLYDRSIANISKNNPDLLKTKPSERAMKDAVETYGDPMKLAEMMKEIDNPASALKFAREATKATTWEKLVEAWKAAILSGPVTHMANIVGNTTFAALRAPVDSVAALIGKVRGGGDKVSLMEPLARVYGNLQGTADGLRLAAAVMKTGEQPGKSEQFRTAIEGVKGDVIRLPFRFLSAADAVFSTMSERAEAHTLATRQATAEGLNPLTREFRERVVQIVENPSMEMKEQVESAGKRFTFNSELGEKGQAVTTFVRQWHLEWAVPFIRTPGNVMKELTRMTPLAPLVKEWRDDIAKGGSARDKAIAEVAVGAGIMSAIFYHAMEGNITGAGEPDPGKRRIQQAAGWQPYSVKVGDTYYNYQRLQPVGTLIGMAADIAEVWDHLTPQESDKVPKMLAVAFANAVTNQTFLQGIANIVNAMSDPQRFGPKLAQQYAGSVVPAIVAQPTQMLDPVVREVDSILDAVKARVPGLRSELMPKRDPFGEPIQTKERMGAVSPVTETTASNDKVRTEAARLGISVADTPKKTHLGRMSGKMGDVPLEPDERDRYAEVGGKLAHTILEQMVNAPNWDEMPDLLKKNVYRKVFSQAHRVAAQEALPMEKRLGLLMEITEKVQAELAPAEQ